VRGSRIVCAQTLIEAMLGQNGRIAGWHRYAKRPEAWRADEHQERGNRLMALLDVAGSGQNQLRTGQRGQLVKVHSRIIGAPFIASDDPSQPEARMAARPTLCYRLGMKLAMGVAIGIALGAALGNVGVGVALGAAFGAAFEGAARRKARNHEDSK
jgi:hypothetical protein